jgi:2-phospho-L-lactate guanylyltransferase
MARLLDHCLTCVCKAAQSGGHDVAVTVVTSDHQALQVAERHGARVSPDQGAGPNAAVTEAVGSLRDRAAPVCVLAADLPLLDTHAVRALWAAASPGTLVLATDRMGAGTNAVVLPHPDATFPFAFGPASLVKHARAGRARGWQPCVLRVVPLAFDLDEPWDLDHAGVFAGATPAP